jgi:hypothetical protein
MSSRGTYLIAMLVILFLANIAMLLGFTNWPQRTREGFAAAFASGSKKSGAEGMDNYGPNTSLKFGSNSHHEYFTDMLVKAPGTNFATAPVGSYDGVNLAAGLPPAAQGFRANHPNEPLNGPPVVIDDEHLFLFANNQCKPECCDSTLACDGGCVCTTPEQRTLINTRGGNRVQGSDF